MELALSRVCDIYNWIINCQSIYHVNKVYTYIRTLLISFCVQRKSNKAKEKKARRLEERAAMDAVCAKVDAANKVIHFEGY